MGFFKKAAPVRIDIPFDADWADAWESLRKQQENKPFAADIGVSFDEQLLRDIWISIESHTATERIVYDEEIQPINNVGESYRQKEIADFCKNISGEDLGWLAGFLLPEMANEFDKNAVAIYVMKPTQEGIDSEVPVTLLHGGYMDKESAAKVHKKILNLIGKDKFIPLLIKIQGGTPEKPNYGVFAYAKTKAIKFP